jgi:hypothetical protein
MRGFVISLLSVMSLAGAAFAQDQSQAQPAPLLPAPDFITADWPEAYFEIFRLAPGQHEAFVRRVALADEAQAAAGLPPTRLYFHESGGDWDVLVLKVVGEHELTPEQQALVDQRWAELGLPTGPAYYVDLRTTVASHSDTHAIGPVSAAQWLARLDAWRAEHAERQVERRRR